MAAAAQPDLRMSLRDSIDLIMQSVDFDEGTRAKMWGILQNMSAK
jgi:hypothetical protein